MSVRIVLPPGAQDRIMIEVKTPNHDGKRQFRTDTILVPYVDIPLLLTELRNVNKKITHETAKNPPTG